MFNFSPITQLVPIVSVESNDVLPIVDDTDLTQSPSGSTKKVTMGQILNFVESSTPWIIVTQSPINLVSDQGYIVDAPVLAIFNLPLTANVGDQFFIEGFGANLFQISQHPGQSVIFDNTQTTVGTGGFILSTNPGDGLTIMCVVQNTTFKVRSFIGTLLTF